MSKQFLAILAAIVIVFAGIILITNKKSNNGSTGAKSGTLTQHYTADLKSSVTLTEYGDYQCPYCEEYYTTVKQVVETNKDKIRFQFRNFPLIGVHQNAFAAARAAEAADQQGKFWEMHDALYTQSNWQVWSQASSPETYFDQYAQQLGLNVTQFKNDFSSDKVNSLVNADMAEGNRLGITGTPTFFLDGKQIQVGNDPAQFQKLIDTEVAKKAPQATTSSSPSTSSTPAVTNGQ